MKKENSRDLKMYFNQELRRLRNLQHKYSFVVLESSLGEVIGQCLNKGWDLYDVAGCLTDLLGRCEIKVVRSDLFASDDEKCKVFERGHEILEQEWKEQTLWGMDVHDIWFLSQVSLDPKAKYIWTNDGRMLDYGTMYLEIVCNRKVEVVDSLRGIK